MSRYTDAYGIAGTLIKAGPVIRGIGVFLGILFGVDAGLTKLIDGDGRFVAFYAIGTGIMTWAIISLAGTLVSAMGQLLRAQTDLAVTNSPFLEKARTVPLSRVIVAGSS